MSRRSWKLLSQVPRRATLGEGSDRSRPVLLPSGLSPSVSPADHDHRAERDAEQQAADSVDEIRMELGEEPRREPHQEEEQQRDLHNEVRSPRFNSLAQSHNSSC